MVILGLGSNVGDRLMYLRQALKCLQQHADIKVCQVSPVYESDAMLPPNAPNSWHLPFFNAAVACTTTLLPYAMLKALQEIELQLGRDQQHQHWGPRTIDFDILYWPGVAINSETLTIPHKGLYERPFALWPLIDVYSDWDYPRDILHEWNSRFTGNAPFGTRQVTYRIDDSIVGEE